MAFEEWQRQQKALKDADRFKMKRAASFARKYRGNEADINLQHQKQQRALKNADRHRMERASSFTRKYRGDESDINLQHQKQQKALKDVDRQRMERAASFSRKYRGDESDINYQHQKLQKALKDADRVKMERNPAPFMEAEELDDNQAEVSKGAERIGMVRMPSFLRKDRGVKIDESPLHGKEENGSESDTDTARFSLMSLGRKMFRESSRRLSLKPRMSFSSSRNLNITNSDVDLNGDSDSVNDIDLHIYDIEEGNEGGSSTILAIDRNAMYDSSKEILSNTYDYKNDDSDDTYVDSTIHNGYYDWTAVSSFDRDSEAEHSKSIQPTIISDEDGSSSSTFDNHGVSPSTQSPHCDYHDRDALPSDPDIDCELEHSHHSTNSQSDSSRGSLEGAKDRIQTHVRGREANLLENDDEEGQKSEISSLKIHRPEAKPLSLRGIMFNTDILKPLSNSDRDGINDEGFFDAKQELSGITNINGSNSSHSPDISHDWEDNQERRKRKMVQFIEDEDNRIHEWYDSADRFCHNAKNDLLKNSSGALDIYNEVIDCPWNETNNPNYSKAEFYNSLYADEIEETSLKFEDDETLDRMSVRGLLFTVGEYAVFGVLSAIRATRNDQTPDEIFGVEEVLDVVHAAELVTDSTLASSTAATSASMSAAVSSTSAATSSTSVASSAISSSAGAAAAAAVGQTTTIAAQ